jgi:hypothetical protein
LTKRSGYHYYPVVAGGSERIRACVWLDDAKDRARPPSEIAGGLEFDGLPGLLRSHVEERNLLAPNDFVIRHAWIGSPSRAYVGVLTNHHHRIRTDRTPGPAGKFVEPPEVALPTGPRGRCDGSAA